jgi:hypothetical protein
LIVVVVVVGATPNVAVTARLVAARIVSVQVVADPVQVPSPLHPENNDPLPGVSVRVTEVNAG